jgi:ribonucleotide reductase alpha subunit
MTRKTSKNLGSRGNASKLALSDNQKKVIRDKYLRDAPGVEDWLEGVCRNIALAELLFHPDAEKWGLFEGVKRATGPAGLILLHDGLQEAAQRDTNFAKLISNLEKARAARPEARRLAADWAGRFYELLSSWDFLPNSPTLMNAGRELQQLSACYVLPVPDSMEGITKSLAAQSLIQKSGGGTGFSFSALRPAGDVVKKTHGVASGAISFMQLFDKMTEVVKQGGTRRGANMGILHYTHPEIKEFITMKAKAPVMENFNVSVGIDDSFMKAVAAAVEYDVTAAVTGNGL